MRSNYSQYLLQIVDWCLSQGLRIVPIEYGHKPRDEKGNNRILPGFRKWDLIRDGEKTVTRTDIENLILKYGKINICVVHPNLVEIDIDTHDENLEEILKELAKETIVIKSGKGYKVLFLINKPFTTQEILSNNPDVRIKGNLIMFPPSLHPNGHFYVFLNHSDNLKLKRTTIEEVRRYAKVFVEYIKGCLDNNPKNKQTHGNITVTVNGRQYTFKLVPKNEIEEFFKKEISKLPPCVRKLLKMSENERSHDHNVFLRDFLMSVYKSKDLVFSIFKKINGEMFDPKVTAYQIAHWFTKHYKPMSCANVKSRLAVCSKNCKFYNVNFSHKRPDIIYKIQKDLILPKSIQREIEEVPEPIKVYFPHSKARKGQIGMISALVQAIKENKSPIIMSAPTGYGKSSVILTSLKMIGTSSVIVVPDRGLQNQLYEKYGVMCVKGKRNYKCPKFNIEASKAPCTIFKKYKHLCEIECEWKKVETMALETLRNNGILAVNHGNMLKWCKHANVIVIDEAHKVLDELSQPVEVKVDSEDLINLNNNEDQTKVIQKIIIKNIQMLRKELKSKEEILLLKLGSDLNCDKEYEKIATEIEEIRHTIEKLSIYYEMVDDVILYSVKNKRYFVKPITEDPIVKWLINTYNDKIVIFVSATPPDIENAIVISTDYYVAQKRNAPIIYLPIEKLTFQRVKNNQKPLEVAAEVIAHIFEYYKYYGICHQAIIHTVNTNNHLEITAKKLQELGYKVLKHEKGKLAEVIEKFKNGKYDFLLVASADAGYDMKNIGLQFILKMPYPDLSAPDLKALKDTDPEKFKKVIIEYTIRNLEQMCGRINRAEEDIGVTIILDKKFEEFFNKYKNKFSEQFKQRLII